VSWLWTALLACAIALVVAAEWPRLGKHAPVEPRQPRRPRRRQRRKPQLELVRNDEVDDIDEFAASVERDLDQLPTISESERRRPRG
jgi:hypothetical protein